MNDEDFAFQNDDIKGKMRLLESDNNYISE
jgi:hypothetical protein